MVLVTGPQKRLRFGWWATKLMLWRVGLAARYVHPGDPEVAEKYCGVVIGGGDDINPQHYGHSGAAGAHYDLARDELEISIIKLAQAQALPILGICRGSQLINVVMGGTLIADLRPLRENTPNRNSAFPVKTVRLASHSRLSKILGQDMIRVNSLHHQAVDRCGEGLRAAAWDSDNFIQAIEAYRDQFILGVQWHPEYLPYKKKQLRLFRAFAEAVRMRVIQN